MPAASRQTRAELEREIARLSSALAAKDRELADAAEQRMATSLILRTIAGSPAESGRALDKIAETTARLFNASGVGITAVQGDELLIVGAAGPAIDRIRAATGGRLPLKASSVPGVAVIERRQVHIPDLDHLDPAIAHWPGLASSRAAGDRTMVGTPLIREGEAIGALVVHRSEPGPFTVPELSQIAAFADHAVIAIENARLLTELRESLDRQTATAEVLRTIASAPAEAERALDTIANVAARLFGASDVNIMRLEGGVLRHVASLGELASAVETAFPDRPLDPSSMPATAILERRPLYIADLSAPEVRARFPTARLPKKPGSVVAAPLMREGEAIGAIVLVRDAVRPFTEMELAQVQNFADQAVIAIENARLLNELREALERQMATSDILRAIASSPGEAEGTLRTIAETTQRLTGAAGVSLRIADTVGEKFKLFIGVGRGAEEVTQQYYGNSATRYKVQARTLPWTVILENRQVHIPDLNNLGPELSDWPGPPVLRAAGIRTVVGTPLRSQNGAIGAMIVLRDERKPFEEDQLNLLQSFADQAAIAIENARLLSELREARDEAERNLMELRAAQANLIQTEKMASLGQLTAGIAHEIKNPLNFVNNFAGLSVELLDELKQAQAAAVAALDSNKQAEIDEIAGMLTSNLEKIAEHGRRADGIVKSMLAHSRGGSGDRQEVNLNALVEDALNLAYHGARAQDQSFNIALERDLDPALGPIEGVPQELTRVFLNLFGNGFYAANKRRKEEEGRGAFSPTLKVTTREADGGVEIRIRDNGVGIPADILPRLFEPFVTTKPTGEGTGLGLSISYEIVTRQHGGQIKVESEPGAFTEFTVTIPQRA